MKIEDYLKSSELIRTVQSGRRIEKLIQRELREYKVTFPQALILISLLLETSESTSPMQLSRSLHISKATLSQHLSFFESQGLIYRQFCNKDARKHFITLTHKGKIVANQVMYKFETTEKIIDREYLTPS